MRPVAAIAVLALLAGCAEAPAPAAIAPGPAPTENVLALEGACTEVLPKIAERPPGDVTVFPLVFQGARAFMASFDDESATIRVHGVDLDKGAIVWSRELASGTPYQPLMANDRAVLVKAERPTVFHALDPATGETMWTRSDETIGGIAGEMVVFDTIAAYEAVEARSGAPAWTLVPRSSDASWDDENLYFRVQEGGARTIEAYSLDDGRLRWRADAGPDAALWRQADELVLMGTHDLARLDAATGRERWRAAEGTFPQLAFDAGRAFLSSQEGVLALDDATGRELWRAIVPLSSSMMQTFEGEELSTRPAWIQATAVGVLASSTSFDANSIPSRAQLTLLDLQDGKTLWTTEIARPATVRAADALDLVVSTEDEIVSLSAATGSRLWGCDLPAEDHVLGSHAGAAYLATPAGLFRAP